MNAEFPTEQCDSFSDDLKELTESFSREMLSLLADKGIVCPDDVIAIWATKLIPLYYTPLMYCGIPGDPLTLPTDGEKVGRCTIKWAKIIAKAVMLGELYPRDPDTWAILDDGDALSADCLVSWQELDNWSQSNHGLSCAVDNPTTEDTSVSMQEAITEKGEATLYKIIGALAQALGESAHTDKVGLLDHGKAVAGSFQGGTGIVGYLSRNGLTELKKTALEKHIGEALKRYDRPRTKPES